MQASIDKHGKTTVLTDKNVRHQGGRQAEGNHQDIGDRKVYDEKVRDSSHTGRSENHGDHKEVPHQTESEDQQVSHTIHGRHGHRVTVKQLGYESRLRGVQRGVHHQRGPVGFYLEDGGFVYVVALRVRLHRVEEASEVFRR